MNFKKIIEKNKGITLISLIVTIIILLICFPKICFSDEVDEYVFDRMALLLMVTEERPEQPEKAEIPMVVTLEPMVREDKLEQSAKEEFPMCVTLLGMSTDVRPEQPLKAPNPIIVKLLEMVTEDI